MIFVHCGLSKLDKDAANRSKKLLQQISDGKYEGVASLLALMETCETIRGLAVEVLQVYSAKDWKAMLDETIQFVFKHKNLKIIENNPDERMGTAMIKDLLHYVVAEDANKLLNKYEGKTGKNMKGELEHQGVGCLDCLHIALAKRVGCDMIATFDRDFEDAKAEIEPFIIQDRIW
jgi:predicted nucleic acid-binding protein